jgi:hypothetical protein
MIRLMFPSVQLGARLAGSLAALRAVYDNRPLRRVELAFLGFSLVEWGIWEPEASPAQGSPCC